MQLSELMLEARPYVQRWIQEAVDAAQTAGGGGAPSPHTLDSSHHAGTLASRQAPQFALLDGSRAFTGNISLPVGGTVDGVDISVFKGLYDAHLSGDSHPLYALAEGFGTRPAAYANRLNRNVNTNVGSGLLGGGTLTGNLNLTIDFANAAPPSVGLSGSVGVVAQAAREDHTHAIDIGISPTWTGLHAFTQVTTHQGGIFLGFGDAIQFGGADAILYASGTDTDLLKTDNHFRVGGMLGVNVDPMYRMHVKAGAANETLLVLENPATTSQMVFDVGTAFNGVTSTPRVGSSNYASQTTGWRVDNEGGADFRYLFADELHVRAFIADIERALAGGQIITKSVAILTRDFTVPAVGFTAFLYVEDLPGFPNAQVFTSGDYVRLRVIDRTGGGLAILDAWGSVTSYQDNTAYGGPEKEQRWTFTTEHTSTGAAVGKIAPTEGLALDYGHPSTGGGYLEALAYGLHTPYYQIVTWVSNPWTNGNLTVQGRYGNVNGITDVNLSPTGFGFYTKNGFLDGTIFARDGRILNSVLIGGGTVTAQQAAGWAWGADATYIDGGQIFTGTVNASKLNVGLGGGNLIVGANWNDDPVGGALVMPDAWGRAFYGTVNYHRLSKDTTGSVTGTQGENYIEASAASSSGAGMQSEPVYIDITRRYTLSAYAKRLSGSGTTSIGVECYNSSGSLLGYRFCTLQGQAATGASGLVSSGGYRYSGTIGGTGSSHNEFIAGTHFVKIFFWVVESVTGSSSVAIWQVQFEEGDMPTAWSPGLRGNIQIDNQMIMAGTPGAQRTTIEATGLKGYNPAGVVQVHLDASDGKLKAGAGKVELSSEGFALRTTSSDAAFFLFKDGANAANLGTMYVYKRLSPGTKTMGFFGVTRTALSTPAELYLSADTNSAAIALVLDGGANSGAGEIQAQGVFRVTGTNAAYLGGGLNVGSATGAGTGEVKASGAGDFSAAGVRTRYLTTNPTGGADGDIAVTHVLGTSRLWARANGTWKSVTLT